MWTLAFGHHEDRIPTHGYEPTREAAMAAFAKHGDGGETSYSGCWKGLSMSTTVLAYLILFIGFITFLAGAFGALMQLFDEVAKTGCVPVRYYGMMVGLISGGLGLIGIGQGLRNSALSRAKRISPR